MKLADWQRLNKQQRAEAWQHMSGEERQDLWISLAAFTPGYNLPYPDNYQDPADSPLALRNLATATDTALGLMIEETVANSRFLDTAEGDGRYSPKSHNHSGSYAPVSHTHKPSQIGIVHGTWTIGNLNAGVEVIKNLSKPSNSTVLVTVQHHSTYIFATANTLDPVTVSLKCRNSTNSTNHTNVKVYYAFIPPG